MTVCGIMVFYTIQHDIVWFMRVLHGKRDYTQLL